MSQCCVCIPGNSKRNKRKCRLCFPVKVLQHQLYKKIREAVRAIGQSNFDANSKPHIDYEALFGCSRETFEKTYVAKIEAWNEKFGAYMGTLSHSNSQADHICPFATVFKLPTIDLQIQASYILCHVTNLQPMPAQFNQIKSNHWCAEDIKFWHENIWKNFDYKQIYWPHCVMSAGKSKSLTYLKQT
jgi:hypothetical protein